VKDLVGRSTGKQESHGLYRKCSVTWMNEGSGIMTVVKKEELQKTEERTEKSHRQGQEGISRRNFGELDVMICCT